MKNGADSSGVSPLVAVDSDPNADFAITLWKKIRKDPAAYFSKQNRANWATRLGDHAAVMFTYFWASDLALNLFTTSHDRKTHHLYANRWPLPVGRQALRDHVADIMRKGTVGYFGDPSFLGDLMPFDGNELAAVIIDSEVGGCRVEAFGLVRIDSDFSGGEEVYRIDSMKFRITGADPAAAAVREYCREVGNWWKTLAGEKMSPGRHSKQVPYQAAQAAYWHVREGLERESENRKPSYKEVCDHLDLTGLGVGVTRFGELVQEWAAQGFTWPPPPPD